MSNSNFLKSPRAGRPELSTHLPLTRRELLGYGAALGLGACCAAVPQRVVAQSSGLDPMGWPKFYPDDPNGLSYYSTNWSNGQSRYIYNDGTREGLLVVRGDGRIFIDGQGTMTLDGVSSAGSTPRAYFYDPAEQAKWTTGVELTFDAQYVSRTTALSYQGFVAGVGEHQDVDDTHRVPCRTSYLRHLLDGRVNIQCERAYHVYFTINQPLETNGNEHYVSWPGGGGIPANLWVTNKFVCYGLADGRVRYEI